MPLTTTGISKKVFIYFDICIFINGNLIKVLWLEYLDYIWVHNNLNSDNSNSDNSIS